MSWPSRLTMAGAMVVGQAATLVLCIFLFGRFWDDWASFGVKGGCWLLSFLVAPSAAFLSVRWTLPGASGISWAVLVVVVTVNLGMAWLLSGVPHERSIQVVAPLLLALPFAAGVAGTYLEATARTRKVAAAISVLVGAWWLFGFEMHRTDMHIFIARRVLGRVTRVHLFSREWIEVERFVFPWSEPFKNGTPITDCAAIFPERWQDQDQNGQWDTWLRRVGPDRDGHCQIEYQVDTDQDGVADWTFVADYGDYEKIDDMMKARRGF